MPVTALPVPLGGSSDKRWYRRSYVDPLGQPMTGSVAITSLRRLDHDGAVLPADATAVAELADGVLQVALLPGFYRLVATLTSASGHSLTVTDTVTITA
jgi:hypothetical protein